MLPSLCSVALGIRPFDVFPNSAVAAGSAGKKGVDTAVAIYQPMGPSILLTNH